MNPNQESTEEQAAETAEQMDAHNIGGGVIETYVIKNPQGSPDFRHFTFNNGATGINAGLCRVTIEKNPQTWPEMLAADINGAAPKEEETS